jgi:glucose-6-phosphate isomerase, archaeal
MKLFDPISCTVTKNGEMLTNATGRYRKALSDLRGLYADREAFAGREKTEGDRVVYEVAEFRPSDRAGDMIFGVTRMVPGKIGDEFFMTRGHIHRKADRPEIYFGQEGHGVMLMESPEGEIRVEEIGPQRICYVPPYWIHRSVNVGEKELTMLFAYPADSGQNYDIIDKSGGMAARIVDDGTGGWRAVANLDYRRRSKVDVTRALAEQ